jgi:hypothetical protein
MGGRGQLGFSAPVTLEEATRGAGPHPMKKGACYLAAPHFRRAVRRLCNIHVLVKAQKVAVSDGLLASRPKKKNH